MPVSDVTAVFSHTVAKGFKKNPVQTSGIKSGNSLLGLTHLKENSMFTMSEDVLAYGLINHTKNVSGSQKVSIELHQHQRTINR